MGYKFLITLYIISLCTLNLTCTAKFKTRELARQKIESVPKAPKPGQGSFTTNRHLIVELPLRPKITSKTLFPEEAKITVLNQGLHKSMKIDLGVLHQADYVEFAICHKKTKLCEPKKESPYSFSNLVHIYPGAPAGNLRVYLRACVTRNRAIDLDNPCGPWQIIFYKQPKNNDPILKKFLVDQYAQGRKVLLECKNIRNILEDYREKNPKSQSRFDNLIKNYLNFIAPEACQEVFLSDNWIPFEKLVIEESFNPNYATVRSPDIGSAIILSLGIPTLISGFAAARLGLFSEYKFHDPNAQNWLRFKATFAGEEPNFTYFNNAEELVVFKDRTNQYLEAVTQKISEAQKNKMTSIKEMYLKQEQVLLQERQFIDTYTQILDSELRYFTKTSSLRNNSSLIQNRENLLQEKLQSFPKALNVEQKFKKSVLQAELLKIHEQKRYMNESFPSIAFTPGFTITRPGQMQQALDSSTIYKNLQNTDTVSAILDGVIIGIEALALKTSTMKDQEAVKERLHAIFTYMVKLREAMRNNPP